MAKGEFSLVKRYIDFFLLPNFRPYCILYGMREPINIGDTVSGKFGSIPVHGPVARIARGWCFLEDETWGRVALRTHDLTKEGP